MLFLQLVTESSKFIPQKSLTKVNFESENLNRVYNISKIGSICFNLIDNSLELRQEKKYKRGIKHKIQKNTQTPKHFRNAPAIVGM